ncbi:hypothetical protein ATANTOWER_022047 [Ataeniobius toweri]|uniref:Uncharacterized protein n=1 Tax=Ataeniobius toweri TaxID=208326 RepID=A0ABU7C0T4_9TELE|nr:hypothetical protein [Ataeniobius toweri]
MSTGKIRKQDIRNILVLVLVLILVVFRFIRDQVSGPADSVETPRRPSPQTPPPAPLGGAQCIPRPAERHSPSSVSWAVPWASSRWDVSGTPPKEGVQEASGIDARATSTGSSRCGGTVALLHIIYITTGKLPKHL